MGVIHPWVNFPEVQFSSEPIVRGANIRGDNIHLGGNCPGAIFIGDNCPLGQLSGGQSCRRQLSEWQLSGGQFSFGVIVQ